MHSVEKYKLKEMNKSVEMLESTIEKTREMKKSELRDFFKRALNLKPIETCWL